MARFDGLCKVCHAQQTAQLAASGKAPPPAAPPTTAKKAAAGNGAAKKRNGSRRRKPASKIAVDGAAEGVVVEDMIDHLTPEEAETWGRLYAEFKSHDQAAQILSFQRRELDRQHEQRAADLERKRQNEVARAREVRTLYEQVTSELCEKYRKERQYTVIDVEARVIREERPQQ